MCVPSRHFVNSLLFSALLAVSLLIGCRSGEPCEGAKCTPRSPWESPTIQVTRSLLLVNREELRIISIDGHQPYPTCVSEVGVEEYHLLPGWHTITAAFRYSVPEGGVLADVHGEPLTVEHEFLAEHEYVAVYREYEGTAPEGVLGVAPAATNALNGPEDLYWTLDIIDVGEPQLTVEAEVTEARSYLAWVKQSPTTARNMDMRITY